MPATLTSHSFHRSVFCGFPRLLRDRETVDTFFDDLQLQQTMSQNRNTTRIVFFINHIEWLTCCWSNEGFIHSFVGKRGEKPTRLIRCRLTVQISHICMHRLRGVAFKLAVFNQSDLSLSFIVSLFFLVALTSATTRQRCSFCSSRLWSVVEGKRDLYSINPIEFIVHLWFSLSLSVRSEVFGIFHRMKSAQRKQKMKPCFLLLCPLLLVNRCCLWSLWCESVLIRSSSSAWSRDQRRSKSNDPAVEFISLNSFNRHCGLEEVRWRGMVQRTHSSERRIDSSPSPLRMEWWTPRKFFS